MTTTSTIDSGSRNSRLSLPCGCSSLGLSLLLRVRFSLRVRLRRLLGLGGLCRGRGRRHLFGGAGPGIGHGLDCALAN